MRRLALSIVALLLLSACVADDAGVSSGPSPLAAAQDAAALKAWEQWLDEQREESDLKT